MENLGKKVGFLKGLMEGMSFDTDSANGKLVCRDVTACCQQILDLLRQACTVRDLDWCIAVSGCGPCDDVIVLWVINKGLLCEEDLAIQTT